MARLGSDRRPLILRVQTQARAQELLAFCNEHGLKAIVGIEPEKPEEIGDLERALHTRSPVKKGIDIGPNAPCPCGSGKKYKRCCMGENVEAALAPPREAPPLIGRLAISRIIEEMEKDPKLLRKMKKEFRVSHPDEGFEEFAASRWDRDKLRKMSTPNIIAKIRSCGVQFDSDVFKNRVRKYISAIRLADDHYYPRDGRDLGWDEDFIWLAIVELWKRIIPDRVNVEMLDDAMQEGYSLVDKNDCSAAMGKWQAAWEMLKTLIPADIKSVSGADEFLPEPLTQSIGNWYRDFEMQLSNAGMYEQRIAYCREFLSKFPESEEGVQGMLRAEAESYAELGDFETADRIFKELTDRFPSYVWGYVGWGDIYWLSRRIRRTSPDYDKAESIYKMGLGRCTKEVAVIKQRLDDMLRERGKNKLFQGVRNFIRKLHIKNSGSLR